LWDGYCADPFILHAGDFYYCYGTCGGDDVPSMNGRHFVTLRSCELGISGRRFGADEGL